MMGASASAKSLAPSPKRSKDTAPAASAAASAGSGSSKWPEQFEQTVLAFIKAKDPQSLGDIETLLKTHRGQQEKFFEHLAKKYAKQPSFDMTTLTKSLCSNGDKKSRSGSGVTFVVDPTVENGGKYCSNPRRMYEPTRGQNLRQAWLTVAGKGSSIDAMSPSPKGTVAVFTKQNLFVKAVHAAFFGHHPLILSPDMIWTTIAQGLAHHVDQNAEKLRHLFVKHKGKKELVIRRDGFVKGSPHNDWPGVFPEFSAKIKANSLPGTTELLENDFTTTGPVEKIVSHITLMDAVQHYFSYSMCCGCGFPSITLTGTPADWEKIRRKAEQLGKYGLDWWLSALLPALDQFVAASKGKPDLDFWMSLCHINVGTSMPRYEPLTGWVQAFFPYLIEPGQGGGWGEPDRFKETSKGEPKMQLRKNKHLGSYLKSFRSKMVSAKLKGRDFPPSAMSNNKYSSRPTATDWGVELENFPPGMSSAPFVYDDGNTGKKHKMAFMGGVATLVQHADKGGALEPRMGWAVLDSGRLAK